MLATVMLNFIIVFVGLSRGIEVDLVRVKFFYFIQVQVLNQQLLILLQLDQVKVLGIERSITVTMLTPLLLPIEDELLRLLVVLAEHFMEHALRHFVFLREAQPAHNHTSCRPVDDQG